MYNIAANFKYYMYVHTAFNNILAVTVIVNIYFILTQKSYNYSTEGDRRLRAVSILSDN